MKVVPALRLNAFSKRSLHLCNNSVLNLDTRYLGLTKLHKLIPRVY